MAESPSLQAGRVLLSPFFVPPLVVSCGHFLPPVDCSSLASSERALLDELVEFIA